MPGNAIGGDVVAEHGQLCRQQPHSHDPHPDAGRFELRLADGAAIRICSRRRFSSPDSDGIKNKRDPASDSISTCTPRGTR